MNKHRQLSTQANFLYLGLVNVNMIIGLAVVSTVCYRSINSSFCLALRYIEVDDLYQLFAIDVSSG